ncbi:hypothetical protein SHIRM173S_11160 [Streptomyces hirsutus]
MDRIQEAGDLCSDIGPIVIASQLENASGFNAEMKGANGEEGHAPMLPGPLPYASDAHRGDALRTGQAEPTDGEGMADAPGCSASPATS